MAGVVVVAPQRRAGGQHAACRVEEASALRAGHLRRNQGVWLRPLGFGQLGLALRRALSASQTMPQAAWSFGQPRPCTGLGFDMARSPRPSWRGPPCCVYYSVTLHTGEGREGHGLGVESTLLLLQRGVPKPTICRAG